MKIKTLLIASIACMALLIAPTKVEAIADWEGEYFTYGSALSEAQLKETRKLLGIENRAINEIVVNKDDFNKYTGLTTKDSSLYSSAIIIKKDKGSGVDVYINTPENITKIQSHQYMTAALTSGIKDSDIIIASPVKVSGESALVGIYTALSEEGVEVDEEATKVANEELSMLKEITDNNEGSKNFSSEELTLAISEIKQKIAEIENKEGITEEKINEIVNNELTERNLVLNEADRANIVNWVFSFKDLNIDWKAIGGQLQDIGGKISEKTEQFYEWGQNSGFFDKIWNAIKSFFSNLFQVFSNV